MPDKNVLLLINAKRNSILDKERIEELSDTFQADEIRIERYDELHSHLRRVSKSISIQEIESGEYYSLIISIEEDRLHDNIDNLHTLLNRDDEIGIYAPILNLLNPMRRKYPQVSPELVVASSVNFKLFCSFYSMSNNISNKFQDETDTPFILFNKIKNANLHIVPIHNGEGYFPPTHKNSM